MALRNLNTEFILSLLGCSPLSVEMKARLSSPLRSPGESRQVSTFFLEQKTNYWILLSRLATPLTILEATIAIYFFFLITLVGVVLAFFWHSCFVCVFSPDSLGIYLKGNRFIAKYVGLFILRPHFLSVEIEFSGEETEPERWTVTGRNGDCFAGWHFM